MVTAFRARRFRLAWSAGRYHQCTDREGVGQSQRGIDYLWWADVWRQRHTIVDSLNYRPAYQATYAKLQLIQASGKFLLPVTTRRTVVTTKATSRDHVKVSIVHRLSRA